ncbi:toprim domain-containing protein [Candidatus Tisiphia endosymbiont of Micropterix aruncella]|uniref:toprim domain-containing protein n=1 Tax=Candidatus Tisiphia endosymbiont of Micropterix aruncella TaxID=3066271 RepID=UPI003AA9D9D2
MNDTDKQTNESQEVISVGQQGGAKNTNPPTYNNSHSEKEYQSNLSRPLEMIDLKQQLLLRAESIATSLLGEPNKSLSNSHTLCWGKKGEISMMIVGEKAGIWHDLKEGKGGDLFDLVQKKKNCNFVQAKEYLQGMVDPSKDRSALDELYELDEFDKYTTEQEQKAKDIEMTRIKYVQTQYKNSNPVQYLAGVYGEYLGRRGIKTVLATHQLSPNIRGVMMMGDSPSQMSHPTILAFARDCKGIVTGVQAIYLDKDNVLVNKRCLGKISGSFVEIQKGMPTDFQENKTNITIITRGVENALSIQEAGINGKILCSLGVINIKNYQPQVNERILIAANNYGLDAVSQRTVTTAKAKLEQQGAIVSVVMPPREGDFNDVLRTQGKETLQNILLPEVGKLATYRHKNIKPMFQIFQNELKSLEKFATAENINTALQTYKQQNMEAFIDHSHKICSRAIEQKIKNDLITMRNKFDPDYDLGNVGFCDVVIRDFNGRSHAIPEDYLVAITKDKQVLQYINLESIIGRQILHELRNTSEVQKNQGISIKPI